MQKQNTIEHSGIVKSSGKGHAVVSILSHAACSGCYAKGICDLADQEEKEIEAVSSEEFSVGEQVIITMEQTMGFRALTLGYILPFMMVLLILIIMTSLSVSELLAGITAFLSLFPYYVFIYLKKEKIGKSFTFNIKKQVK